MVQHITSKATVKSLDEGEGTGLVDDEDSNSSVLSSSSDSENDDSPLIQAIDKILTGKTKSKGKGKGKNAQNTQGTKQDASEFVSCIYVPLLTCCQRINPQLL
jgi:hypothetical protein